MTPVLFGVVAEHGLKATFGKDVQGNETVESFI